MLLHLQNAAWVAAMFLRVHRATPPAAKGMISTRSLCNLIRLCSTPDILSPRCWWLTLTPLLHTKSFNPSLAWAQREWAWVCPKQVIKRESYLVICIIISVSCCIFADSLFLSTEIQLMSLSKQSNTCCYGSLVPELGKKERRNVCASIGGHYPISNPASWV